MAVEDKITVEDTLNRIRGIVETWYEGRDTAENALRAILVEGMDHLEELSKQFENEYFPTGPVDWARLTAPTDPEIELQEEEDMRNGRGHYEKI